MNDCLTMENLPSLDEIRQRRGGLPAEPSRVSGPIFNQDSTEFFFTNRPESISGELIDRYIDLLAYSGIGTFVSCVNAQRTNYASKVWQSDWEGFGMEEENGTSGWKAYTGQKYLEMHQSGMASLIRLAELGIDFHHRAFERCRQYGIATWISVRMNDLHDCDDPHSPLLSDFFNRHRAEGLLRSPYRQHEGWWSEFALDWERADVREHYMKLICERLEQDDLDGLELDWMRFVYHFRPGRELIGGALLSEWIKDVRRACDRAGERLGRRVLLGMRVPADPQMARRCGLDAVSWARDGLVDLLIPSPFCATCDFDMPIETWRQMIPPHVKLAGGLDVRCAAIPNTPSKLMTPELTLGAAANVLHAGGDYAYLFNYFPTAISMLQEWTLGDFARTVFALRGLEQIAPYSRSHAVTFRDARSPGEAATCALPAWDRKENFPWPPGCLIRLRTGLRPGDKMEALLRLSFSELPSDLSAVGIYFNGEKLASPNNTDSVAAFYDVPVVLFQEEVQIIEVVSNVPFRVVASEIDLIAK